MTWDDELGRELTPEEELARLRANPTSLPQAILEEEAKSGARSDLRNHPTLRFTVHPRGDMTPGPDVPIEPETPKEVTAEDLLRTLHEGSRNENTPVEGSAEPQKQSAADELAALLHPEASRVDTGTNPVWPPTPVPTGAQVATLPKAQQPRNLHESIQRAAGVDPLQMQAVEDRQTDPIRQAAQGAIGSTLAAPWTIAAGATALPEYLTRKIGITDENSPSPTGYSMARADNAQQLARNLTGASEQPDTVGKIANTVGSSVIPSKGYTLPLTAAMASARLGVDNFAPHAEAAPQSGVTHTVESIGGPAQIKDSELMTLGGLAAVTLGAIFAPTLYTKFKYSALPRFTTRPVENAAPGTVAGSNLGDLARTYDDANAGILRLAKRAGLNSTAIKNLSDTFQIQTRATAQTIANSAVVNGRAEVPNFTFRVNTPLAELNKTMTKPTADYLHTRDTLDELLVAKQKPGQNAGPPVIRGMTENDALQQIWALEQANPGVQAVSKAYRENLNALRKFETTGEYATLSPARAKFLRASRQNEVPWNGPGSQRVTGEAVDRGNPIEALSEDMTYRLRARMENEAKGSYVDAVRKVEPDMFKRVYDTKEIEKLQAKNPTGTYPNATENPHWKDNTVTIYRRGKKEMYTTDPFIADVMRMDPYYFSSTAGQIGYSLKRGFEMTTTGGLAPWFAPTSALRNWLISKHTAPAGTRSPTLLGTAYAVPQQLVPQLAERISESLDTGSMGWLRNAIGQPAVDATSRWMANAYANSLYARIQSMGTHKNSLMEQQVQAQSALAKAIENTRGPAGDLLHGYSNLLSAIHNAPSFNFIARNAEMMNPKPSNLSVSHTSHIPLTELTMEARNLTGDPHIGGRYYNDQGKPIRFENGNAAGKWIVDKYGAASELGRDVVPWFNQTEQGAKRLGQAYLDNPAKFTGRFWLYSMMPAAGGYLYARSLGNDPNGTNYVDYMMNRRSEYAKTMYYYIPVPGRPAEEGIEWPRFHEGSILARQMEAGLDHLTRSAIFKESEDFHHAAASFLDVAVIPPMPPVVNTLFATQGMVGPQGVFGGESYFRKSDPFDQTAGMPSNLELLVRSLAPGIGEIGGAGWAAMTQTPDGALNAMKNAFKEMSKRMAIKTPIVRDIANLHTPISGNTEIVSELFRKQKSIDQLVRFYKKYDIETGIHTINTKPISKTGAITADKLLGPNIPSQHSGLDQPPPTNPLYDQFMQELYLKVQKDSEKTGGEGYKSLWDRYRDLSDNLTLMRNINAGNLVTWKSQMDNRPEQLEELSKNRIDRNSPYAVRNYYERKRQDAAKEILFRIRDIENQFSQKLGRPIHIEDLSPYGTGGEVTPQEYTPANE